MANQTTSSDLHEAANLAAAARLMNEAWQRPCWHFDAGLLREYLDRPSSDPRFCLATGPNSDPTGFFAGVPMTMQVQGTRQKAVFTTFLTVAEGSDRLQSLRLLQGLLARARQRGCSHAYTVFFRGTGTLPAVQTMFKLCRAPMVDIAQIDFLMAAPALLRATPCPASESLEVVPFEQRWHGATAQLLDRFAAQLPLAEVLDPKDLDVVLSGPRRLTLLAVVRGQVRGLILIREREVLTQTSQRSAYLDLVVCHELEPQERESLMNAAIERCRDAATIVAPHMGQFEAAILLRRGFLRIPHRCTVAVAKLTEDAADVAPVERCWVEVF